MIDFCLPAAHGMSDLSNISMISMAQVNETNNLTVASNMTTRLDAPDPTDQLDMTKTPADLFLDGCKVI